MADGEALAAQACLRWPEGDAEGLRAAARALGSASRSAATVATRVARVRAADAEWTGRAASRFTASVTAEAAALRTTAGGLGDGGRGLGQLAEVVEEAQQEVRRWARRLIDLEEARAAADALAVRAAAGLAASAASAALAQRGAPADDDRAATRTAMAARRLEGEVDDLRRRARAAADAACERVRRADARCASTLRAATARTPLPDTVPASPPATPLAMLVGTAFAPRYRFDQGEDHYPMDVRDWLARADLKQRDDGTTYYDPRGEDVRNGDLDGATLPFAYHVTADGDLQLEYGAFYAFNDFPGSGATNALYNPDHEGDFEPTTVQLGRGGRPEAVDYEAHGHAGVVAWRSVVKERGRPVVFPAHGGHGNHPRAGRYDNDFTRKANGVKVPLVASIAFPGLAGAAEGAKKIAHSGYHDDSDGRGRRWDPQGRLLDARSVPALRGDARFGEDTGGNPRSVLHPSQGPPPDLDRRGVPRHPDPR